MLFCINLRVLLITKNNVFWLSDNKLVGLSLVSTYLFRNCVYYLTLKVCRLIYNCLESIQSSYHCIKLPLIRIFPKYSFFRNLCVLLSHRSYSFFSNCNSKLQYKMEFPKSLFRTKGSVTKNGSSWIMIDSISMIFKLCRSVFLDRRSVSGLFKPPYSVLSRSESDF